MKLTRIISLIAATTFAASPALAFQGPPGCAGQDCASCHNLTKEEAGKMLKLDVTSVGPAPAKGLWEIEGTQNGKKVKVHMDFGKKFAIIIQGFIPIDQIGKQPEVRKLDVSQIPLADALVMGNPLAKKKVIIFTDPDCPYCKKLHTEIKEILKKNNDIAFYIKLFPLANLHPQAYEKSKAILCKKSIALLDDVMEGKNIAAATCDTKAVDDNIKLAAKLGIGGTPAIILPDGRLIPGFVDAAALLKAMEAPQ